MNFLIMISLVFLVGAASCDQKVDAFKCVTLVDDDHNIYLRCRNPKKKESFNSGLGLIGRCIKDKNKNCQWVLTDLDSYEIYRKEYESKCKAK